MHNQDKVHDDTYIKCEDDDQKECVILLHGILGSKMQMHSIENALKNHKYNVFNIEYKSTKYNIEMLSDIIWREIKDKINNRIVHFVGYSMGGLIVRIIIKKYSPKKLGRVVLIGTPNCGSEIADYFKNNLLYRKFLGPAGQELGTKNYLNFATNSMAYRCIKRICNTDNNQSIDYEIGCIVSKLKGMWKMVYPISIFLIKKENDGLVSLESAKMPYMRDCVVLSCGHFFLPHSKKAINYIISFLETGKFSPKNSR